MWREHRLPAERLGKEDGEQRKVTGRGGQDGAPAPQGRAERTDQPGDRGTQLHRVQTDEVWHTEVAVLAAQTTKIAAPTQAISITTPIAVSGGLARQSRSICARITGYPPLQCGQRQPLCDAGREAVCYTPRR